MGFGVVARSFAEVVMSEGPKLAKEYGLKPKVVGIVDSHGAALDEDGLDLRTALASKKETGTLAGFGGSDTQRCFENRVRFDADFGLPDTHRLTFYRKLELAGILFVLCK